MKKPSFIPKTDITKKVVVVNKETTIKVKRVKPRKSDQKHGHVVPDSKGLSVPKTSEKSEDISTIQSVMSNLHPDVNKMLEHCTLKCFKANTHLTLFFYGPRREKITLEVHTLNTLKEDINSKNGVKFSRATNFIQYKIFINGKKKIDTILGQRNK